MTNIKVTNLEGKSPRLVVYRASAGSGKTFTLAVEYIKLLVENPEAYRNILAVTFTNKATAEMKERILSQLYGISIGDKNSNAYLQEVKNKTNLSEAVIRKNAGEALENIIHDYSRFHVETIDTFSVSLMRSLAKELSIGTNMNIELNSKDVLDQTVDKIIEKLDEDAQVLGWLSEYMMEQIEDDKSWRVFDNIKEFGKQIFDETFIEEGEKLKKQLSDEQYIDNYKKTLRKMFVDSRESLKEKADIFFNTLEENGIVSDDLPKNSSVVATYFKKIKDSKIEKIELNSTLNKIMDGTGVWVSKSFSESNPQEAQIILALADEILLDNLIEAEKIRKQYISLKLTLKHINELRLLEKIDNQMEQLNRMNYRFLLSNINKLLHMFIKDSDTPFIFEKLGTTIRNLMIDEFQDTSRLQWNNFKPLLLEGLSSGGDGLIVGDVKQSIYRWRGGDWNILNSELNNKFGAFPIKTENLLTNRRSAKNIIDFNNAFFTSAYSRLSEKLGTEGTTNSEPIELAYQDVEQNSPSDKARGYVKISILSKDDYDERTTEELAHQIKLLKEKNISDNDIAILVRKNKQAKLIAEYLSKNTDIKIVSDEAFRLDASSCLDIIISALRCLSLPNLENEKSKLVISSLAYAYQKKVVNGGVEIDSISLSSVKDILKNYLPKEFSSNIEDLKVMPLQELVEKLFSMFELSKIKDQDGYMCAFYDAISEYCDTHVSEILGFVNYWDEKLYKKTIPVGDVDGIRILTIHKAKGLEFNTVLIPFCDWSLGVEGNHIPNIWCRTSHAPYKDLDLIPISFVNAMQQSIYKEDYYREKIQLCVDNLNLLYVAFTRAKDNLFIWTKKSSNDGWNTFWLLNKTLDELEKQQEVLMTNGEDEAIIFEKGNLQPKDNKEEKQETNKLLERPQAISLELSQTNAKFEFRQSNRSSEFISKESKENKYINRGLLLHNLFSYINTVNDVPSAIEHLRQEGLIESKEQERELEEYALNALKRLKQKEWFDGSWQIFNESEIVFKDDCLIQTRRPDRVMIKDGNVVVIDYKSGKKYSDYQSQVKTYMDLISKMGYPNVKGYLWYIDNNEVEEVNNG